jgi:hypothetical protein
LAANDCAASWAIDKERDVALILVDNNSMTRREIDDTLPRRDWYALLWKSQVISFETTTSAYDIEGAGIAPGTERPYEIKCWRDTDIGLDDELIEQLPVVLELASEAKGAAHTITPNHLGDKVYASVELPELMRKPNVTQIDGIDRTALADMCHQLRTQHGYTSDRAMDVVRSRISVQSAIDLEQTHGIKSMMHPELRQAQETLRAAPVDLQGSVDGRALTSPPGVPSPA